MADGDTTQTNGSDEAHADIDALKRARAGAAFIPLLTTDDLLPPKLPTKSEMENVLLELRKQALVNEYFGD
jgi:pre-mRNA-splicing factor ISY1